MVFSLLVTYLQTKFGLVLMLLLYPFRSLEVLSWFNSWLGSWPSHIHGSLILLVCSCISAMPCVFSSLWSVLCMTSIHVFSLQR